MRVGIDLVCIEEVSTSLARFGSRYLDRIFSQDERADCLRETAKVAPVASRHVSRPRKGPSRCFGRTGMPSRGQRSRFDALRADGAS